MRMPARSLLLALHRTAVLRHDEYGQETLLNLLLRNYLHYNLYDQARPCLFNPCSSSQGSHGQASIQHTRRQECDTGLEWILGSVSRVGFDVAGEAQGDTVWSTLYLCY